MHLFRLLLGIALLFVLLGAAPPARAEFVVVSPLVVDFGEVKMGAEVLLPITVRNPNNFPLEWAGGGMVGSNAFTHVSGGNCSNPIPANSTCTMNRRFQPRSVGQPLQATTVFAFSGNGQYREVRVWLHGVGGESLVRIWPRIIDFGDELIGATVSVPVTVTNTHSGTITWAGGGIGAPFSVSNQCGNSLAPGQSCQWIYHFTPGQVAEVQRTTTLGAVASNPEMSEYYQLTFRGRGRTSAGSVQTTPVRLDFGPVKIGSTVSSQVLQSNRTNQQMIRSGGGFNDDLAFWAQNTSLPGCGGGMLPPASTCAINHGFSPLALGVVEAETSIAYSSPDFYQAVPLHFSGRGVGTLARVSPVEIDFGDLPSGQQITVPVTLTNTSPEPLTSILGGASLGVFTSTSTCGSTLAPGASCTLSYRFQPHFPGSYLATPFLSYQSDGLSETVQIVLTGSNGTAIFINGFD